MDLMIRRRAKQAGIPNVYAHPMWNGFAQVWLAQGGQEQDLMMPAAWLSRTVLGRYGASATSCVAQYRRRATTTRAAA